LFLFLRFRATDNERSVICGLVFVLSSSLLVSCKRGVYASGAVGDPEWSMFRHDLAHTGTSPSAAPNTNSTLWIYAIGHGVGSSPAVADGKVYGIEFPYSSHSGLGTSRPEVDPLARYAESLPKFHTSNVWYPGNIYCFGARPTKLSVHTDPWFVNTGENVEITVDAQDLSQSHYLPPAFDLPVNLRYVSASGASGDIGTVKTGASGSAAFTWSVAVAGSVTIVVPSPGNNRHEASPDASVPINVGGGITLSTVRSMAGIIALTVSATAITVPMQKRKQEGGEQLED